jgi:hypothetical protein
MPTCPLENESVQWCRMLDVKLHPPDRCVLNPTRFRTGRYGPGIAGIDHHHNHHNHNHYHWPSVQWSATFLYSGEDDVLPVILCCSLSSANPRRRRPHRRDGDVPVGGIGEDRADRVPPAK